MNPCPFANDISLKSRDHCIKINVEHIKSAAIVEGESIFFELVIDSAHIRDTDLTNVVSPKREFCRYQRLAIAAFLKAIRCLFGCGQECFVLGIINYRFIKSIREIEFVSKSPFIYVLLSIKTKSHIAPRSRQHLSHCNWPFDKLPLRSIVVLIEGPYRVHYNTTSEIYERVK